MSSSRRSRLASGLAALGVAAALLGFGASGAAAKWAYTSAYTSAQSWCVRAAASQLDPHDLNVMHAPVSAAARLAVAIQLRQAAASCGRLAPVRRHWG
jgi:hypothetical protein